MIKYLPLNKEMFVLYPLSSIPSNNALSIFLKLKIL